MDRNFKATIKLPQAVALYIGAVLGSGILIIPGLAAEIAGPASMIAWGAMMLLVIPLALCMGFLSQRYPSSGGVSYFVTKAFGEKMGAIIGWFFLMSVPIGAPIAALTGASYLSSALNLSHNTTTIISLLMLIFALVINYIGMDLAGKIQIAVVVSILVVLVVAVTFTIPSVELSNFTPYMPNGLKSVGKSSSILFWCFIGWEAVSHLSEEFVDPEKDVVKATIISAIIVGILYFMVAFVTIGTRSYGTESQAPLVILIGKIFGPYGSVIVGIVSVFICTATVIAYIGAASRVAFSLSKNGDAPKILGYISKKYKTPIGGLGFLGIFSFAIIILYYFKIVTVAMLINIPNSTFILTYLAGCASGVVLLKDSKIKLIISIISLVSTIVIFIFAGWFMLYPLIITFGVLCSKLFNNLTNKSEEVKIIE